MAFITNKCIQVDIQNCVYWGTGSES